MVLLQLRTFKEMCDSFCIGRPLPNFAMLMAHGEATSKPLDSIRTLA
jgi:hypothetical protein